MMWFFRHFRISITYHIFLLNQVQGAIAIPPSYSAPLPLVCPSIPLSVHRSVNHIFRFLHICWQVTGKEWHRVRNADVSRWHADVSRWLTLSIHGCLWILLLVCLSVHLSVCSFTAFSGASAWAWKKKSTFWHTDVSRSLTLSLSMLMGIIGRLLGRLGLLGLVLAVGVGGWAREGFVTSLGDMGDICCRYWQHILVSFICFHCSIRQHYPSFYYKIHCIFSHVENSQDIAGPNVQLGQNIVRLEDLLPVHKNENN